MKVLAHPGRVGHLALKCFPFFSFFFCLSSKRLLQSCFFFFFFLLRAVGEKNRALEREHTNKEKNRNELEPATFSRLWDRHRSVAICSQATCEHKITRNSRPALASAHPMVHFPHMNHKLHSCTFFISYLLIYPEKKKQSEAPAVRSDAVGSLTASVRPAEVCSIND